MLSIHNIYFIFLSFFQVMLEDYIVYHVYFKLLKVKVIYNFYEKIIKLARKSKFMRNI